MRVSDVVITIATDDNNSAQHRLALGKNLIGIVVPTLDATNLTLEASLDNGSTWVPLYRPDGSAWSLAATTGGFCMWIDGLSCFGGLPIRFVSSANQSADRTFKVLEAS
jgi:hypothetical protein